MIENKYIWYPKSKKNICGVLRERNAHQALKKNQF